MNEYAAAVMVMIALMAYLLPTAIAAGRKKKNTNAILALNVLLGWTFIGWIVAFVWSLTQDAAE